MSNSTVTNVDTGSVILQAGEFRDDILYFESAGTVVAGTILARDSISHNMSFFKKGSKLQGHGIPKAVLTYDVTATGRGPVAVRDMVSGSVRAQRLVIHVDGDARNVDAAVLDQLRDYCLLSIDVQELNTLDNQ